MGRPVEVLKVLALEVSGTLDVTCAAVEGQLGGGVELLDEELREGNPLVRVEGAVPFFPVEHQVIVSVRIWQQGTGNTRVCDCSIGTKKSGN